MLINITQEKNHLKISKINKDKRLEFIDLKIPTTQQYEWDYCLEKNGNRPDTNMKSWDGKSVYKKFTKKPFSLYRQIEFIENLSEEIKEDIYDMNIPEILYVDIETAIIDGFPDPQRANSPVTCIGFFTSGNVATVIGTKELSWSQIESIEKRIVDHFKGPNFNMEGFRFNYKYYEYESDMLYDFFSSWLPKYNVVTGWNFIDYDWVYLINRAKKLNVDYEIFLIENAYIGKETNGYPVTHKLVFDYMKMFDKFGRSFLDTVENMKLDYISDIVLGSGKIKYNGSLQTLYETDFETYVFYNIVDTMLVKFINDKTNLFNSFTGISNKTRIETAKAFSPVHLTEVILCRKYLEDNKVMPNKDRNSNEGNYDKVKIPGGYVKIPEPGYYEMVLGKDYASLYPSIMRLLNLSPESYMGKNLDESKLKGKKYIKTPANTFFEHEKDSVLKKLLDGLYGDRKSIQRRMEEIEQEISQYEKILNPL